MDGTISTVTNALGAAEPYWPFIAQVLALWYLGQFAKKRVWTRKRAAGGGFWKLMRDTLPLHPIIAGALWGATYPFMPAIAFVDSVGGAITEGIIAGIVSVGGHAGLESIAAKRGWTAVLAVLRDTVTRPSEIPLPEPK